jgi:hypothetical protein
MPFAENVELLSYHDLDGHAGFKLAMQETDGRFFLYVASLWHPAWAILDVTEPEHPRLVRWVDGPANTSTVQIQVADNRMITGLEHIAPAWQAYRLTGEPSDGFIIWDVSDPENPVELGRWVSGARGTHRNFYDGGRYVHACTTLPGFDGHIYGIVDIEDPASPTLIGKWWWPGQNKAAGEEFSKSDLKARNSGRPFPKGATPSNALALHGGAYVSGDRAYCPWMRAGLVILDIADIEHPRMASRLPVYPPLGSSIALHTAVPIPGRDLVIVNSEALNESCDEPVNFAGLVDVSDEDDPILISLFPQPRAPRGYGFPNFCAKGGRFGPHNQHQPQGMPCLQSHSNYVYLTYFNAGLQIFDISEPRDPFIAGYYIPDDPVARRGPMPHHLVMQAEDVIVDRRGNIFMSEKNSGIYALRFSGRSG